MNVKFSTNKINQETLSWIFVVQLFMSKREKKGSRRDPGNPTQVENFVVLI